MNKSIKPDWILILLYLALVGVGWVNIYSASLSDTATVFFDLGQTHTRQLLWIGLSFVLVFFFLGLEPGFYERYSSIIYLVLLVVLAGLPFFGMTISGQTSWYSIGDFRIQPAEFAKVATALALAKYLSDFQTVIARFGDQLRAFVIIGLPVVLIMLQPDAGSALVFLAFIIPMYREGLPTPYLLFGFLISLLFITTLAFGPYWVIGGACVLTAAAVYFFYRKNHPLIIKAVILCVIASAFSIASGYIYDRVFQQHHRDRFDVVLGKETDPQGISYNLIQSQIAIGSGGWTGKGWAEGTQTKGNFVPEQHTDFIFSTVGEEWGFLGSLVVIGLFTVLISRILTLAERQKTSFARIYGYGVASVFFVHFFVNISMVTGLFPTVGIPLPFLSYGGSSLWGFTALLFVFIRLDSQKQL